jgi:hypothetical protein
LVIPKTVGLLVLPVLSIICQAIFKLRLPPAGGYAIALDKVLKDIEVALLLREGIVWEIEPLPESYDREILRFKAFVWLFYR